MKITYPEYKDGGPIQGWTDIDKTVVNISAGEIVELSEEIGKRFLITYPFCEIVADIVEVVEEVKNDDEPKNEEIKNLLGLKKEKKNYIKKEEKKEESILVSGSGYVDGSSSEIHVMKFSEKRDLLKKHKLFVFGLNTEACDKLIIDNDLLNKD